MLVLTRKLDQSVIVSDDIEVKVVGIEKGHVKLGFDAPTNIVIHRKEVYERIQQQNRKAAGSKKKGLLRLTKKWQMSDHSQKQ